MKSHMSQIRCWRGKWFIFKRTFSVLNHLPAFGFLFIAVSVFAGMRLCSVYISRLCLRGALNFPFFSATSFHFLLIVPFYPRLTIFVIALAVYMCSGKTSHMSLRCSRGFLIYFGPSCPASELNSYTMRHGSVSPSQF